MSFKFFSILAAAIIAIILLGLGASYAYDLGKQNKTMKADNDRLTENLNHAQATINDLQAQINRGNTAQVVYIPVPGKPPVPIEPGTLSIQASDSAGLWHFSFPPAMLSADTLLSRAVEPYKCAASGSDWKNGQCVKRPGAAKPKFAQLVNRVDIMAGRSIPGYRLESIYEPAVIGGSKFHAGLFVAGYAELADKGSLTGGAWAGVRLTFQK